VIALRAGTIGERSACLTVQGWFQVRRSANVGWSSTLGGARAQGARSQTCGCGRDLFARPLVPNDGVGLLRYSPQKKLMGGSSDVWACGRRWQRRLFAEDEWYPSA